MAQATKKATDDAASNTALDSQPNGYDSLTAHIDWISLSFKIHGKAKLDKLIHTIQELLQISIYFDNYRNTDDFTGRYKTHGGTLGISFSYSYFDNNDRCNARLTLPGGFLADRRPWHIKRVCRRLRDDWGAICTRIDLAVDDTHRQLDYQKIIDATKHNQTLGFRSGKTIDSYGTKQDGKTVYCGSRRSSKYARFYNKETCDRFEIEYKQNLAVSVFTDYLSDYSPDSSIVLSSILQSSISFIVRKDKNLSRATECQWWTEFKQRIVGTFHPLIRSKPRPSLDRTLKWIHRSVSKSLLLMREALGDIQMEKLLQLWEYEAKSRCNSGDVDRLRQFNQHGFSLADLMNMI